MPYTKARGATGNLSNLAQTIAVPHDHRPLRLPSFPNLERTAVFPALSTGTLAVAGGAIRELLVVRSAVYPVWSLTPATAVGNTISLFFVSSAAFGNLDRLGDSYVFPMDMPVAYTALGTDPTAATAIYPVGYNNGACYAMSSTGSAKVQLNFSNGAAAGTCDIVFELFDGMETRHVTVASATIAAGTCSAGVTDKGWFRPYSVTLVTTTAAPGTLTSVCFGIAGAGPLIAPTPASMQYLAPLFPPPEFAVSALPYSSTRSNAVGVLLSNVTAVLDKEGTISAARIPVSAAVAAGTAGVWSASSSGTYTTVISNVHPQERYFGPMEKGLYCFTMPDQASEKFRDLRSDVSSLPNGAGLLPRMHLDSFDYVSFVQLADLGGNGTTLAFTVDNHLEFRSSSMLFPVGFSTVPLEEYHASQMALASLGVFFENPIHLATIAALARAAAAKFAPIVMPYARGAAMAVGQKLLSSATKFIGSKMGTQVTLVTPKPPPRQRSKPARRKPAKAGGRK